jgi:hypothetical protein
MKDFIISISEEAYADMAKLARYITYGLKSQQTSDKYMAGVDSTILKLSFCADGIGVNEYVQSMYGINARHITYKKMAIIFFIEGDVVYIKRVIASSLLH